MSQTTTPIFHAWYSEKQRRYVRSKLSHTKLVPAVVYLGENGEEIICTEVTPNADYKSRWDDVVYVGKVTRFIRRLEA
jgi:hypothetical protein